MKPLKLREDSGIDLSLKNLVAIVVIVSMGIFAYTEITARLTSLETSRELMNADLLKASEQTTVDKEQFILIEDLYKTTDNSNEEYLAIYTDGSTFNNGSKKKKVYGGIGVFFGPDDHRNISQSITLADFPPNMDLQVSNNTCELLAVIRGIEKLMFSLGESDLIKMRNMSIKNSVNIF